MWRRGRRLRICGSAANQWQAFLPRLAESKEAAEQAVSAVASRGTARARDNQKPTGWERTRLGVVVPLCVVVAVAIVCIIVAALSSANRADEVALDNEKQLLMRAIANHGEWSLRRLHNMTAMDASIRGIDLDGPVQTVHPKLARWLEPMRDHDLVWVVGSSDQLVYGQAGRHLNDAYAPQAAYTYLRPVIDYLRDRAGLPPRVVRLIGRAPLPDQRRVPETVLLTMFLGRVSVISAVAMPSNGKPNAAGPMVVTGRFIEDTLLNTIADQLRLDNLRTIAGQTAARGEYVFDIVDASRQPVVRFAWLPQRPGAEILNSVIPFIGIALAGFALLTGLVLRFMRRTAETIAAGENRLRYLALHDPLCGLPNRNYFSERLEDVIAEVRRGGPAGAVFYIDLDHFKDVNDTLGHPVGDELIRNVTRRLSGTLRGEDLVARLGGDEFAVITSVSSDHAVLLGVADRIIGLLSAPFSIDGHTIVIGASIGIAIVDGRSQVEAADVMRYADMALYRAKNEGRNRACVYDAAMDADLSNRKLVEQELREAIENGSLDVLYQPIVNASGETVVGVEALARWPHPTRGVILPGEFIPVAEYSGLIIELGSYVLRRACLDGKAWPGLTVAVNVSPLQFRQIDFYSMVERVLNQTGFDPRRLELELTESTLIGNVESAEASMSRLRSLGVQLALDDFGTGYSSLQYLRRFPFDKIKIDRSFTLSIEKGADGAAIVHAVVSLGRGLGMKVTAEGVETADQHLFLRAAGVHYMQGYRFGKPMKASEITARLAVPGVYRSIEGDARAALAS
jgi:diguanylate cyclase (GGDEF)-like protein